MKDNPSHLCISLGDTEVLSLIVGLRDDLVDVTGHILVYSVQVPKEVPTCHVPVR